MAFNRYSLSLVRASSQYAYVADNVVLSITGDISIEAWIKLGTVGVDQAIVTKDYTTTSRGYGFYIGSTNLPTMYYASNNATFTQFSSNVALTAGRWYHIAVAVDVSVPSCAMYIDGVAVATTTNASSATSIQDSSAEFVIGARQTVAHDIYFDGLINNVRVWSDIRSGAEILAGMYTTYTGTSNNLVGSWYATANNHNDLAGTNNLTAVNTPVFSTNVPWTGANSTDWTVSAQIKADNTKVSGASDLTNFPVLIKDGNIPDSVYGGLQKEELNTKVGFDLSNLVGYWRMEGNSNDTITNNNLTDTNITYSTGNGKFGQGAGFNSTPNSFMTKVSPTAMPTGNADCTINVWANPRVTQSASVPALITFGTEANYQMAGFGLSNTGFYWLGYSNDASMAYSYATGSWTMFTVRYTASSKTVQFFANGVAVGAGQVLTNTPNVGATFLNFSKQRPGNAVYFDGMMDDASIWTRTLSDVEIKKLYMQGDDLRITTDSAGTAEIPYEIVSMDTTAKTAEVWAKIPTLTTATDTSIYLWSGNASAIAYDATTPFGSQAVWSSNYKYVDHLQGQSLDSTVSAINGTDTAITYNTTNGMITQGAGFNGSSSKIDLTGLPDPDSYNTGYSVSLWVNFTSVADTFYFDQTGGSWGGVMLGVQTGKWYYRFGTGVVGNGHTLATGPSTSTWYHIYITHNNTADKMYVNGSSVDSSVGATLVNNGTAISLGNLGGTQWLSGKEDEVRVMIAEISADWIATEYANQNSPSTFWSTVTGIPNKIKMINQSIHRSNYY